MLTWQREACLAELFITTPNFPELFSFSIMISVPSLRWDHIAVSIREILYFHTTTAYLYLPTLHSSAPLFRITTAYPLTLSSPHVFLPFILPLVVMLLLCVIYDIFGTLWFLFNFPSTRLPISSAHIVVLASTKLLEAVYCVSPCCYRWSCTLQWQEVDIWNHNLRMIRDSQ